MIGESLPLVVVVADDGGGRCRRRRVLDVFFSMTCDATAELESKDDDDDDETNDEDGAYVVFWILWHAVGDDDMALHCRSFGFIVALILLTAIQDPGYRYSSDE